jgi:hypothetical protein
MHPYQREIQEAAATLINGIYAERQALQVLREKQAAAEAELEDIRRRVQFLVDNPDLDDDGIGTSEHWRGHFDVAPEADRAKAAADELSMRLVARQGSTDAYATALLHLAHHGMAMVNKGLQQSPQGRKIAGVNLRGVVWQGRNQAMHYFEEKDANEHLATIFEALSQADAVFKEYKGKSLAVNVVDLLGWSSLDQFNEDLSSLLPSG